MSVRDRYWVHTYFAPAKNSFWKWTADGTVITWASGRTLAFTEEIKALVTQLAQTSLPPLGAILLFRAACRDDWKDAISEQGNLASFFVLQERQQHESTAVSPLGSSQALTKLASAAFERLDALASLPAEQRKGLPALCELAGAFFENVARPTERRLAEAVAIEFANGIVTETLEEFRAADPFEETVAALNAIASGAGVPTSSGLALRKETGLDAEPAPAEIPVPQAVRQLIGSLRGDPELAAIAAMAHDLLAAVSVPRTLRPADDLPLGGFSDITNRGNLDRLLITELAHDDLTLAVRVATNEALYMRRESPPAHPPERRALLIDAGIRMWGVPRLMATALGLAFVAAADPRVEVQAFRASQEELEPVTLSTRAGIVEHLAALETAPHPARALPAFFKSLDADPDAQTDAIIVTHEAAFADHDFQRQLAHQEGQQLLVATVARAGHDARFRIYQITLAGKRLLSEVDLSVDSLLKEAPAKRPLVARDKGELPVIFSLPMLPLQVPYPFMASRAIGVPSQGIFMLSHNGRLLRYRVLHHPAELVHDLPGGRLIGLYHDPDSPAVYVVIREPSGVVSAHAVHYLSGESRPPLVFKQRAEQPIAAGFFAGILFVVYPSLIDLMRVDSGIRLNAVGMGITEWISGRYFRIRSDIHVLATDGSLARLEKVRHDPDVIHVLERPGDEGPLFVFKNGEIARYEPAGKQEEVRKVLVSAIDRRPTSALRVVAVSPDGSTLVAAADRAVFKVAIPQAGKASWISVRMDETDSVRFGLSLTSLKHGQVRKNFATVAVTPEGDIVLMSTRGRPVALRVHQGTLRLMDADAMPAGGATFVSMPETSRSYDLKVAEMRQGKIFLDSRGMLHVVPRNAAIAQMTFVLLHGETAAWTSDGLLLGPEAFCPATASRSFLQLRDLMKEFAEGAQ